MIAPTFAFPAVPATPAQMDAELWSGEAILHASAAQVGLAEVRGCIVRLERRARSFELRDRLGQRPSASEQRQRKALVHRLRGLEELEQALERLLAAFDRAQQARRVRV